MTTFHALGLPEPLVRAVLAAGYTTPTPIQAAAIPPALAGHDLTGCAQTGTGKTAAFVLPLLAKLSAAPAVKKGRRVRALVVTPTRELAHQVEESVRTYGQHTGLKSVAVYGGVSMDGQRAAFRQGVDIVIATPGRLLDHLQQGTLDLSSVEVLVLDEADRMLDMGFVRDIRRIVALLPAARQTLLFSATMAPEVKGLAAGIQRKPVHVAVDAGRSAAETVAQRVYLVAQEQKMDLLFHVLETESVGSVLVFSRTKHRADRIAKKLTQRGVATAAIHSNRTQGQRQRALTAFRDGAVQVLVATDVAARGLDVDGISHVVNFDTPSQAEDYIHRIGRTGRARTTGDAFTFVASDEVAYLRAIEKHTGAPIPQGRVPDFGPVPARVPQPAAAPRARSGGGNRRRKGARQR